MQRMCRWELPTMSIVNGKPGFDFYIPVGTANLSWGLALSFNLPNNQVKYILLLCIFLGWEDRITKTSGDLPEATQLILRSQDSTLGIRKRFVAILPHLQLRLGSQAAGRLLCSQSSPQTVQYSFPRPFSPFNLCLIKWFPRGNPLWNLKGFHVWTNSSWKWNKIGNKFRPVLVEASLKQPRLDALERKSSQKKNK